LVELLGAGFEVVTCDGNNKIPGNGAIGPVVSGAGAMAP
jgi:hypothetical protein